MSQPLPLVPRLSPTLLGEHASAHARLHAALQEDPVSGRLLTRFAHRTMVAAIANIRPSSRGKESPPLFPVPRSFLSPGNRTRIDASAAAYRYVDSRLAIVRLQLEERPLLHETPYVLNALAEGRSDNPDETNSGMIRGVEFDGDLPIRRRGWSAAPRAECRHLLEAAMRTVEDDSQPAAARAAWMLQVFGLIHPFADGNGRVARLLYLLVAGEAMPATVDWGVVEQLRYHQDEWSKTLAEPDTAVCATATTELSVAGARLMLARLTVLRPLTSELQGRLHIDEAGAMLLSAVWLRRRGRLDQLAIDLGLPYGTALLLAERLVERGVLQRAGDVDDPSALRPSYAAAPGTQTIVEEAVRVAAPAR